MRVTGSDSGESRPDNDHLALSECASRSSGAGDPDHADATLWSPMTLPANGPWTLPVEGFQVYALQLSFVLVDILAQGDEGARLTIRLPGEFDFSVAGGSTQRLGSADSAGWPDFAALFVLRGAQLSSADATEDETQLHIAFVDGHRLRAGPDPNSENWEVIGPGVPPHCAARRRPSGFRRQDHRRSRTVLISPPQGCRSARGAGARYCLVPDPGPAVCVTATVHPSAEP
jgi:hypothetical protein